MERGRSKPSVPFAKKDLLGPSTQGSDETRGNRPRALRHSPEQMQHVSTGVSVCSGQLLESRVSACFLGWGQADLFSPSLTSL